MLKNQTAVQQLQRLRRFQTVFIIGTFALYMAILVSIFSQTASGQIIKFSDPLAVISLGSMAIWAGLGLCVLSAFARQEPTDQNSNSLG